MLDVTLQDIQKIADSPAVFSRGKRYYHSGRIEKFLPKNDRIEAEVNGSSDNYHISIFKDGDGIDGECSCPFDGFACKHIVAVLLKWFYEKDSFPQTKLQAYKSSTKSFDPKIPFDKLDVSEETALKAFELLHGNCIENLQLKKDGVVGIVRDGNKRFEAEIEVEAGSSGMEYFPYCECDEDFSDNCSHTLALLLGLGALKDPKQVFDFEENFRKSISRKKLDEFSNSVEQAAAPVLDENKKDWRVFFSFKKKDDGSLRLFVEKTFPLKSGELGSLRKVDMDFFEENYAFFPKKTKAVFDLMFSKLWNSNYSDQDYHHMTGYSLDVDHGAELLKRIKEASTSGECGLNGAVFSENAGAAEFVFSQADSGGIFLFSPGARLEGNFFPLTEPQVIAKDTHSIWVAVEKNPGLAIGEISVSNPDGFLRILGFSGMTFSQEDLKEFVKTNYVKLSLLGNVVLPQLFEVKEISDAAPAPQVFLKNHAEGFCADLGFRYLEYKAMHANALDIVAHEKDGPILRIKRNTAKENEFASMFLESGMEKNDSLFTPTISPLEWLSDKAPNLTSAGFEIFGQDDLGRKEFRVVAPKLKLEVSSGIDWFDLNAEADFGGQKMGFGKILDSINNGERFVKLADGKTGVIPKEWVEKMSGVSGLLEKKNDGLLRASLGHIQLVESILNFADKKKFDRQFAKHRQKFEEFTEIKPVKVPKTLNGNLREYQKAGYYWLHFLKEFSFGGCLADEMGLGKTIQVLALLLREKENENAVSLVVVPTSLVFNWKKEAEKFAPNLKVHIHHGLDREKDFKKIQKNKPDLIVTTYATLRRDIDLFEKKQFHYVVLDESQQIKNPLAKNTQSVYKLNARHRLVLTGTPIENNSLDLWSQFRFLNPGLLGTMDYFKNAFSKNIDKQKDKTKTDALRNLLKPFILQRKKETVEKDLPEKQVTVLYCEMDDQQKQFYEKWKEKTKMEIKQAIEEEGFFRSKIKILQGLIRLRQICNHPYLVDESFAGQSGKFELLLEQITEVISEGHKALVFSSFVKMLSLFKKHFQEHGIKFSYIDGHTKNREQEVNAFQTDTSISVFLISLKAGGFGLNLTAADYVFIVDPWWNPAAEMQAIDRAHRIGQDKKVFVYKAITKNTVEEKILSLQEKKQALAKSVISDEEGIFKTLKQEDLARLLE